jgi:peptide/nickel transport system substrate-binding protein
MKDPRTIRRRTFVALSAGTAAGALLAACGAPPAATPVPAKPADKPAAAPTTAQPAAAPTTAQPAAAATKPAAAAEAKPAAAAPAAGATALPAGAAPAPAAAGSTARLAEQYGSLPKPAKFAEAPMLAQLVKDGKLPPVEQRLPPDPVVVKPTNRIGKYGGTLRGAALAPETTSDLQVGMTVGLFTYSHDLSQMYPDMALGYEFSSDLKSCTLFLRKGVKWSDGKPFTADDVMFYFEDIQFNKELFPAVPSQFRIGGEAITVTRVDDSTIRFGFKLPNPAFSLIHYSGAPSAPWRAKHYLQQFHVKYNPQATEQAKAAGFDTWVARFAKIAGTGASGYNYGAQDPGMPVLEPWRPVNNTSQAQEYERNPYYWRVDTDGNQLPYVDKLVIEYAANAEVENLKVTSGQVHVAGLDLQLVNYPVLKQSEAQGNYKVHLAASERGADVAVAFNQNHADPVLKQIFGDVRFRQAMSVGINRGEINELVFLGQASPQQGTINEQASFFKKEWASTFAQYDVNLANKLLDEVGLDKKAQDGTRLRPDGKPMAFQLEYLPHEGPKKEVSELVAKHWAKLGIKAEVAGRERAFLLTRLNAMQHDASAWQVDRQLERAAYTYGAAGSKFGPGGNSAITYCRGWIDWIASGGKTGVEPPQEAKDLQAAFDKWQQTVMGTPEYKAAGTDVYDRVAKTLYVIGVAAASPNPIVVKNDVENVFPPNQGKLWWGAANWYWHAHRQDQWFLTSV